MGDTIAVHDFAAKFNELNEYNQRYIIAIQQALMYAQEIEKTAKENTSEMPSFTT